MKKITFRNQKVKIYFMDLCKKSPKTTVDWKKFRELDKKDIFGEFTNDQLSLRFRKMRLIEQGLCWYCGNVPPTKKNGLCDDCNVKINECQNSYLKQRKEAKNAN